MSASKPREPDSTYVINRMSKKLLESKAFPTITLRGFSFNTVQYVIKAIESLDLNHPIRVALERQGILGADILAQGS